MKVLVLEFNPHHDARGRFTGGGGSWRRGSQLGSVGIRTTDYHQLPPAWRRRYYRVRRAEPLPVPDRGAYIPGYTGLRRLSSMYSAAISPEQKSLLRTKIRLKAKYAKATVQNAKVNAKQAKMRAKIQAAKIARSKEQARELERKASAAKSIDPVRARVLRLKAATLVDTAKLKAKQADLQAQAVKADIADAKLLHKQIKQALGDL